MTPNGITITDIKSTNKIVPKIAGKTPPSEFASLGLSEIKPYSSLNQCCIFSCNDIALGNHISTTLPLLNL